MVIQRIQSLFLFLSSALMVVFTFLPFVSFNGEIIPAGLGGSPADYPVYLVLNLAIAILLLIDIFLFKNLDQQINITKITMVMIIGSAVVGLVNVFFGSLKGASFCWYSIVLIVAAFVFNQLALKYMNRDRKLLKSYDKIR